MRIVLGLVVGLLLLATRTADACGFWRMHDEEKDLGIGFLINSAKIVKGERTLGAIYLDDEAKGGLRSVKDRKVVFAVTGDRLTKYGKPIARIAADGSVAFGKRVYTIALTNPHELHGMAAWDLEVKRGDTLVLTSTEATSLCAGLHRDPPMTDDDKREEVRRRVMFYLAWRETGP